MRAAKYVGAWLICALALALAGCATGSNGVRQGIINAEGTVTMAYKALGQADQVVQMKIRAQAKTDPSSAALALQAHLERYNAARKAIDAANDAIGIVIKALPAIDKGLAGDKKPADYLADLASVSLAVTKALADLGVTP